ncbi:TonB-dependent receptor plug domain-containing protein [Pelagicoccus mobilis]|uniref:TonB-dependent receptor plug domain-containing protein n=1 Tax=Pelagicoccus mobilis TaxID=415221 RepID=A0A934S5J7_9BACT|nr:TonB-dependent receptor [Pelagicoccus mobilis]MBK1879348.1 TonB-dependent receptor plug domain-containing protein [Pelagicoccus mobilis]
MELIPIPSKGSKRFEQICSLLLAATVPAISAFSQDDSQGEEIFELSPFTIEAGDDTGYRATSTLAGSRLKSELKDVAASISVVTSEFMEDLGATDIENTLVYVAGVETDLVTDTSAVVNGYLEASPNPGNNRVRGLSSVDVTSDFFQVGNGNLDSYNIERMTLVRGPNSVLFGLGSPAGILDYTTKKAHFGEGVGSFKLKLDSFGSVRGTIDYNKVLVDDKLAVRLMALDEHGKFQFDRAFDNDQRVFLAVTAKPIKATTIRLGAEHGENKARRARYSPPQDNVSGWLAAGRPTWDPVANEGMLPSDVFSDPDQAKAFREIAGIAGNAFMAFTDMNSTVPDYTSFTRLVSPTGGGLDPERRFYRSSDPQEDVYEFDKQVSDERIFPYQDVDIHTLGQSYQNSSDEKIAITLEQKVTEDLFFEFGYYEDSIENDGYSHIMNQTAGIAVDVNERLINGDPNPNFLRPFVYGRGLGSNTVSDANSWRATGSYELDFAAKADGVFRHLGRHQLTGVYSENTTERFLYRWEPKITQMNGPAWSNHLQNANHRFGQFYYVGDPLTGNLPNYTAFPGDGVGPISGRSYTFDYYDVDSGTWQETQSTTERLVHNPPTNRSKSEVEGYGGALQSFFLNGKVVTTFGWRHDEISSWNLTGPAPDATTGLVSLDTSLPGWQFADEPDTEPQSGETMTKGIVVAPKDWIRFHYNESENFAVSAQKVNIFREAIPSAGGEGKDWGVSFDAFNDKLLVKVNWFETSQVNSDNRSVGFLSSWGINSVERQLYGYLKRNNRLAEWEHPLGDKDPNNPGFDANYQKPNNVGDTNDFVSEGIEFEAIYNPTPRWRMAFNMTQVETVQANSALDLVRYNDQRLPYLEQFFDENKSAAQTWADWYWIKIGKPLANAEAANGKVSTALAKYSANFVTNYNFARDGKFKGLSVGGSMRWREGATIGYPDIEVDGIIRSDLDNPFTGPDLFNVGLHASYKKKVFNDKVNWKVQMNIQNLIGDDDINATRINSNGEVAAWRVGRDRYVQLTNTFTF